MSARPPTFGAKPPTLGAQPPTLVVRPPTFGAKPPTLGVQPPTLGARPPTLGAEPPTLGAERRSSIGTTENQLAIFHTDATFCSIDFLGREIAVQNSFACSRSNPNFDCGSSIGIL